MKKKTDQKIKIISWNVNGIRAVHKKHFFAGKGLSNDNHQASILGAISAAKHIHTIAKAYGVVVVLHTDHASRKLLPWIDGLLEASEENFVKYGKPLFSSHMIDLSEESLEDNISTSQKYLERMSKIGMTLEIELGVTEEKRME